MEDRIEILERQVDTLNQQVDRLINLLAIKEASDCERLIPGPRGKDGLNGLNGRDGLPGARGADGRNGIDGYTPIKGVDYFDGINGRDGVDGNNGLATFTSYVFLRVQDNTVPQRPTGGDFLSPLPTTGNWSDGIPAGEGTLYMSSRIFTSTANPPQQLQWTTPIVTADSTTVDFEWSSVRENPGNPTDNPTNWVNTPDENDVWMAMRTLSNGMWSAWKIMKIQGEKGEDGSDGADGEKGESIIYKYAKNGSFTAPPSVVVTDRNPAGWSDTPMSVEITEYLWKIAATIDGSGNLVGTWSIAIRETGLVGPKGDAGAKGDKGVFIAPLGEWDATTQYKGSIERVEAVYYNGNWYVTRSDVANIPIGTLPTNENYWNASQENFEFISTGLFLAELAYIRNLGVENLKTSDTGTRIEILKSENSLKFYVGSIVNPVVQINTDVSEDPRDPNTVSAGMRISALGVGGLNAVTVVSTQGVFSNAGNNTIYAGTTGISSAASIIGLSFFRDNTVAVDAGVAGTVNVNPVNNRNLKAVGGFFDVLLHNASVKGIINVTNGQTLNMTGYNSYLLSYMSNGQSATINLPNFNLGSAGWNGQYSTDPERIFESELIIINGGVNITLNGNGNNIINGVTTTPTTTISTSENERARFRFVFTGSHWVVMKNTF